MLLRFGLCPCRSSLLLAQYRWDLTPKKLTELETGRKEKLGGIMLMLTVIIAFDTVRRWFGILARPAPVARPGPVIETA